MTMTVRPTATRSSASCTSDSLSASSALVAYRPARRPVSAPLPASPPSGWAPSERLGSLKAQRPERRLMSSNLHTSCG